jgi:hypothetical protein
MSNEMKNKEMELKETLFEALNPETAKKQLAEIEKSITKDPRIARKHLLKGGEVFHDGKEVITLHVMAFGDGFGTYAGHFSGDWMNGIFTLK